MATNTEEPVPFTNTNLPPSSNLVVVHGIGANRDRTWRRNRDWLVDSSMLPHDLPTVRVLAFGYLSNWLGKDKTNTRLAEVANELLTALEIARHDCHDRPIIFIGHCFGGIVIEKAIVDAQSKLKSLISCIAGVICMGTPHQGTGSHGAVAAIARVGAYLNLATESQILETLNPVSETLEDTVKSFAEASSRNHWPVHCFYEGLPTNRNKMFYKSFPISFSALIVDEESACLKSWGRNKLVSDHFDLNKFSSPDDPNYLSLRNTLMKMAGGKYFSSDPKVVHPSSPSDQDVVFTVPMQRNHTFHGRRDILWRLSQILSHSSEEQKAAALYGLGGIGKTQIALEWAYQSPPSTHILWANGKSIETLQDSFLEIGKKAGIVHETSSKGETASRVKNWLDSTSSGDWRLIIDNVDDQSSILASIKPLLPIKRGKLLLVGCVTDDLSSLVEHNCQVNVPPWSRNEAATMLLKFTNLQSDSGQTSKGTIDTRKEEALNLADKLGCIPLAIAQAAAYIKRNGVSIGSYTMQLFPPATQAFSNISRTQLLSRVVHGPSDLIPQAVAVTWDYSYIRLKTQAPNAAKLIHFLSYLSPDGIPLKILDQRIVQEACCAGDDFNLIEELGHLRSFAMIQMTSASEEADVDSFIIRLPVPVSLWVRKTKVLPTDNEILTNKAFQLVAEQFPLATNASPSSGSHLASHVQAVRAHRQSINATANEMSRQLDYKFGMHQFFTGSFKDARDLLMSHFNYLKELKRESLELAVCAHFTACSFHYIGDESTEDWYDRAFDLGKDLPLQPGFHVWDNLSLKACFVSQKYEYKRAIEILSYVLENHDDASSQTANNKAFILPLQNMAETHQRLNQHNEALKYWSEALDIANAEYATSPERAMNLVLGKAVSLRNLNETEEAENLINSYVVDLLGESSKKTGASQTTSQMSDNLERVFPVLKKFHRQYPRDIINFKDCIADFHTKEGHPMKALNWLTDAYDQAMSYFGEDNVVTVYIRSRLIGALDDAGHFDEAMKHLIAYIKNKELQKSDPITILRLKADLARQKLHNGLGIDAIKLGTEAYTQLENICPKDNIYVLESMAILADTYLDTGFPQKAMELSKMALERSEGVGSVNDEWKSATKRTLGTALAELNQYEEAESILQESLGGLADDKLEEIMTRVEIAKVMSQTGDVMTALKICHDTREQIKSLSDHPSGHVSTWAIWHAEGVCYMNSSKPQLAWISFQRAEEYASAHFPDTHPYRLIISLNTAHSLMALPHPADRNQRLGNYRKARDLYGEVVKSCNHRFDSGSKFTVYALDERRDPQINHSWHIQDGRNSGMEAHQRRNRTM
ncbi:hypothetical protein VE04_01353 [Pseudogymnoascus sp. 24MN13]|nr:hypothetical protein VE04_01353 [Pseudogymnoascus sp. 24MN13]